MKAAIALLLVAYACLLAAWVIGNPPFAAPDEPAYFVRAAAIANGGSLAGAAPRYPTPPGAGAGEEFVPSAMQLGPYQRSWNRHTARSERVPAALVPRVFACNTFFTFMAFRCQAPPVHDPDRVVTVRTYAGSFQPFPPLVAAAGVALAPRELADADRAGRAALALTCLAFLVIALLALAEVDGLSLVGLVTGVTPMAIFLGASVLASGVAVCASAALLACMLRATRARRPPRWIAPAAALAAAALCLSRTEGPAWAALDLLAVLVARGEGTAGLRRFRSGEWVAAGAVTTVAIVLNRVWDGLYAPHVSFSFGDLSRALNAEPSGLVPRLLQETIGSFNWLETPVPTALVVVWWALIATLALLGFSRGTRAQRMWAVLFLAILAVVPHLFAFVLYETGRWNVSGRYVLPGVTALTLVAGEVLFRGTALTPRTRTLLARVAFASVGLMQLWAWWWNARRHATGDHGPIWFFTHAAWTPPGGWLLPGLLAAVGAAAMISAGLAGGRSAWQRSHPAQPQRP